MTKAIETMKAELKKNYKELNKARNLVVKNVALCEYFRGKVNSMEKAILIVEKNILTKEIWTRQTKCDYCDAFVDEYENHYLSGKIFLETACLNCGEHTKYKVEY